LRFPQIAFYNIYANYYPLDGRGGKIERSIKINGEIPFKQAKGIVFSRVFKDNPTYSQGYRTDTDGNHIRPSQISSPSWSQTFINDPEGFYSQPLRFYFREGENTLSFESGGEKLALGEIVLKKEQSLPSYEEFLAKMKREGINEIPGTKAIELQAEDTQSKSDVTIYPFSDRSNAANQPFDEKLLLFNCIGGEKWRYPGQWIEWNIIAPEDGLYRLGTRFLQNLVSGQAVTRKIMINGEEQHSLCGDLKFDYNPSWQSSALKSEGKELLFYFKKGENTVKLEVVAGSNGKLLSQLEQCAFTLNGIYRDILMIVGPYPDKYRDYELSKKIPETLKNLKAQGEMIKKLSAELEKKSTKKGNYTSQLNQLVTIIEDMVNDDTKIPQKFSSFSSTLIGTSAWLLSTREQPLTLERLFLLPKDAKEPAASVGFFGQMLSSVKLFIMSFFNDYSVIGSQGGHEETINVWLASGRDQATIVKQMCDNDFTQQSKIGVNIKLVAEGTLLPASLAKKGPDVYVGAPAGDPMNFGIRKAVRNLSDLPDFQSVKERFYESAMTPYTFGDKVFALPETQSFPVLFYRKDILSLFNIKKIDTWKDLNKIIPELQKKKLSVGIPAFSSAVASSLDLSVYWTILYQNGGSVFNETLDEIAVGNKTGIDSFKQWTYYYTNFGLFDTYDFVSRFRIGDIPLAIADYTMYNLLSVSAPEISGLWGFAPVPGTLKEDGTIDRSVVGGGTATEMMATTQKVNESWEFMKWWSQSDTQVSYGRNLESVLGTSARYPAANKDAIDSMPWSAADAEILKSQWQFVKGVPEVPGGYLKDREINFAFRSVIRNGDEPREALTDHVYNINIEIEKMRKEFHLR